MSRGLQISLVPVLSIAVFAFAGTLATAQTPRKLAPTNASRPASPAPAIADSAEPVGSNRQQKLLKDAPRKSQLKLKQLDRAINAARDRSKALKTQAKSLDENIRTLRQGMVSAARLIQYHEQRVAELTRQLDTLNRTVSEKEQNLSLRRKQMGRVLLALYRVSKYPPEALIVSPVEPADAVRSAILLRSTVPELENRALALRDDLEILRQTREKAAKQKIELSRASTELESQRKLLRKMIGRKSRLRRRTLAKSDQANKKARSLVKQARSIRELMIRLEMLRKKREKQAIEQAKAIALEKNRKQSGKKDAGKTVPTRSKKLVKGIPNLQRPRDFTGKDLATARGKLPYPAVGPVIAKFGDRAGDGILHKGLTIETSGGAQVIAPYEGRVAFSGPFRGYGELLIIEHREGYHTLLAGMSRIDGVVGQWVLAGEPVGVMRKTTGSGKKDKPTLYLEMRYKGQPINPLPWLASRKG